MNRAINSDRSQLHRKFKFKWERNLFAALALELKVWDLISMNADCLSVARDIKVIAILFFKCENVQRLVIKFLLQLVARGRKFWNY